MSYPILQLLYEAKDFLPRGLCLEMGGGSKLTRQEKLSSNWEGPYRVTKALHQGAYKLESLNGKPIPQTWNTRGIFECTTNNITVSTQ